MKIPLFDIDDTLVTSQGFDLNSTCFISPIEQCFGITVDPKKLRMAGMTHNQILVALLELYGIPPTESEKRLPEMVKHMEEYFILHQKEIIYKPLPGAYELLSELHSRNIPIGILTGNIELIGWGKLENAGLRKFFTVGAFGDQSTRRVDLIAVALHELQEKGHHVKKDDLVIIGDATLDMQCAKDGGIKAIGVTTGHHSSDELKKTGGSLIVGSLLAKEEILKFLA